MKHRLAVAFLGVLLPGLFACSEPGVPVQQVLMFRGDPAHTGVYNTQGVDELGGLLWRFSTRGAVRSSPAVSGERVYIGSTDGNLYALDRATGVENWRVDVSSPISSSPAVARGLVIFGSRDGAFHAVDSGSGRAAWRFDTGALIPWEWGSEGWDVYTSSPVVVDSVVIFGAGDGVVYALDLDTGTEIWRFATEGRIRSTPAVGDGHVFVGSTDGIVYALEFDTGEETWRHATDGAGLKSEDLRVDRKSIIPALAVADNAVYVGSRDGFMYALDSSTGERKWMASHSGSWAMSAPAILGNAIYAGTSDGRFVHKLDVNSGEELWRLVGVGYTWSSPSIVGGTVYIGDGEGYLRAIDRDTGQERWNYWVEGGVYSSPVVDGGVVFFGADDGNVYALHGEGVGLLRGVYWDEAFRDYQTLMPHLQTRVYFEQRGYRVLDATALQGFLEARIADRAPSVVVFAMEYLPASIAAEPSDTVLFRRYLDAGGKVVWLGPPPLALGWNEEGRINAYDIGRATTLLGVDHSSANFDFYGSAPTELGDSWGLERGWLSTFSIDVADGIEVLGVDENGRAGAWVKNFGGPAGTGYIGMGLHRATLTNLEAAYVTAEHRGGRQRPSARSDEK